MSRVLVVFGSDSDSAIYGPIVKGMKTAGFEVEMRICSAHRTPQMLERILSESDAELIIAGAGLSAALPGVVASHTTVPVIGVPAAAAYQGLDSLLSAVQMPQGVPVLAVAIGNAEQAVMEAKKVLQSRSGVILAGGSASAAAEKVAAKARGVLDEFSVPYSEVDEAEYGNNSNTYIQLVELEKAESVAASDSLIIYCPFCTGSKAEHALKLPPLMQNGLWVGLNRGENAALAAVQIRNHDGRHTEQLRSFRKAMAEAVVEADAREQGKWK